MMNSYSPDCDEQGFYRSTQCHNAVGICWCVDKHGVEFANTRTRNNKPNCGEYHAFRSVFNQMIQQSCGFADEVITNAASMTSDDEDDELDDEGMESEEEEGSAERLLVF